MVAYSIDADEEIKKTAYNTSQEKIDKQVANGTFSAPIPLKN